MDNKTLLMLEYPQVINRLAKYASFSASEEIARQLHPFEDQDLVQYKLSLTTEARHLLSVNDGLQLGGCTDLRPYLEIAAKSGTLDAKAFSEIAYTLSIARDIYRSLSHHQSEYPKLAKIAEVLIPPSGLIERINQSITDRGEVLDSASERLTLIRREIRNSYSKLLAKLEKILKETRYQPMLQEAIITQRNGRYVIPLKAEYKGQLKSIIHDQSASGATLFVEPLVTIELNNAYQELQLSERNEILRILHELTVLVGDFAEPLKWIVEALAEIDFTLMCAKYADDLHAAEPILSPPDKKTHNPVMKLYHARHPLLPADKVVPIDVVLDDSTFAVVITGPNTGGKTVSLKTIGLMFLMAQSGLHIPVQSGSELSLFQNIFADIGDEQSIEQSLSTFSGHMTNIIRILKFSSTKTLVLLDELGSGTDPQEGSALARAILQYLVQKRIPCFVATHFSELKAFAHATEGIVNASMEFNLKTLHPTYRLSIGLPGRSNALLIAEKLGLPAEILEAARSTIDPEELKTENLLDEIHRQHDAARKARSQADRMRSIAENSQRELQKRLNEIEQEREKILSEAHAEAEKELQTVRADISRLRKEYSRAKLPLETIKPLETDVKQNEQSVKNIGLKFSSKLRKQLENIELEPLKIGEKVRVRSLGTDSLAVITAIDKEEAEILLGALRMRVPIRDLFRKFETEPEEPPAVPVRQPEDSLRKNSEGSASKPLYHPSPGVEIDLRGKTAEEITDILDKYLDDAALSGLPFVRIIHGKGTGKLRQVTRGILHESPHVKYIETGQDKEGGEGVTVAHMKG
ncbi:endonuclease MutS2 [Flexilinea flocculi]|nr:endonuclease MutS2 [Flexilinea flocculi]NMB92950.1 endonuclease MutS2 [Flexilinea flocculi]